MRLRILIGAGLCLSLGSCLIDPYTGSQPVTPRDADNPWVATDPVLYSRDGTPVPASPSGVITTTAVPARDLSSRDEGTRPYLLELYQASVERNDELQLEVELLTRQLQKSHEEHQAETAHAQELEGRVQELQARVAELDAQAVELAARLTTAQIRRLEAEKLLLETTLRESEVAEPEGDTP